MAEIPASDSQAFAAKTIAPFSEPQERRRLEPKKRQQRDVGMPSGISDPGEIPRSVFQEKRGDSSLPIYGASSANSIPFHAIA